MRRNDSPEASILLLGVALLALVVVSIKFGPTRAEDVNQKRITLGRSVYNAHCARCHGKNMEGQSDWQTRLPNGRLPAPPHDASGHTWHHPDKILVGITKHGLKPYAGDDYESDMPAFAGVLSDQEIEATIAYIKSTWPQRERDYQERISRGSTNSSHLRRAGLTTSSPAPARRSPANEGEQIGIDHIRIHRAHAMRKARIDLERAVLDELGLEQ